MERSKGKLEYKVDFFGRTNQKHASVVTGLDWEGKVMATCGYDQKIKLYSVHREEEN